MKRTYVNSGGSHICQDGTTVLRGQQVTTDEALDAKFPFKFKLLVTSAVPVVEVTEEATTETEVTEEATTETEVIEEVLPFKIPEGHTNVTEDFPTAVTAGFIVTKYKRGWFVFDGDEDPANEKSLHKKDVTAFITDLSL